MRKTILWAFVLPLLLISCGKKEQSSANIIKVKTQVVGASSFSTDGSSYSGTIEESSGSSLSFATSGTVKALYVSEGHSVRAGQVIGIVDATTSGNALTMAEATAAQAQETLRQAEDAYRRMKLLHDNGSLQEIKWVETTTQLAQARQAVRQARASVQIARKGVTDTRLVAPFSGYISKKQVEIGQNVMPGQPVVNLVKIGDVKADISVPEDDIAKISVGQRVRVRISALGNYYVMGKVVEKGVQADPISRSYEVKVLLPNTAHRILPGMICEAWPETKATSNAIQLPANLIQIDSDNQPFVWTVVGNKAHRVNVTLGENVGENVEILGGLSPEQVVITEGQQKVSEGTKVELGVRSYCARN